MKIFFTFLMVSVFTFNSAVGVIVFQVLQIRHKREMKLEVASTRRKESTHGVQHIVIRKGEEDRLEWTEKNREFRYNGIMYDIVKKVQQDSATIYYVLSDLEETRQVEAIEKLTIHQSKDSKRINLLKDTIRLFWSQFELPDLGLSNFYICIYTWLSLVTLFADFYDRDIPTPPPRF